jgi:hypothetical protein
MGLEKTVAGAILAIMVLGLMFSASGHVHPQPAEAREIPTDPPETVGEALWEDRAMDIIFQMAIIIAGAFGVLAIVRGVTGRDQ